MAQTRHDIRRQVEKLGRAGHHAARPLISFHRHLPFGKTLCGPARGFACPRAGKFARFPA
jgi:hypothetical protein